MSGLQAAIYPPFHHLSINLPTYLSVHPSVGPSIHPPTHHHPPIVCLSMHPSVCPAIHLSICLSVLLHPMLTET